MCKAAVKSSPPTNQHPVFYRLDAPPVAQTTVSEYRWTTSCLNACPRNLYVCFRVSNPGFSMFSALAAVCTVDCAIEIVLITLHYITLHYILQTPKPRLPEIIFRPQQTSLGCSKTLSVQHKPKTGT